MTPPPERAEIFEKTEYRTRLNPEWYIVPLLKREIDRAIAAHGVPRRPDARVLDVGCGGQPFRRHLESLGYAYTGIDAMQNPAGSVSVVCAIDAPMTPEVAALGTFDFLFCTEVLEHVLHWQQAFENFRKLLAPGGVLLITCPHFYLPHEEPYDFWRPTSLGIEHFGRAAGLEVIEMTRAGTPWDVLGTFLGITGLSAARPGVMARLVAAPLWLLRKVVIWLLRRESLRRYVTLTGPMYLSTIAVFRQPEGRPA